MMHESQSENGLGTQRLKDIFHESIARHRQSFPEQLANLFVTVAGVPVYLAPEAADHLSHKMDPLIKMIAKNHDLMLRSGAAAMAQKSVFSGMPLNYIAIGDESSLPYMPDHYPAPISQIILFDHELGHLIVKEGAPGPHGGTNLAEAAADAYAMLRYIQRFGKADVLPRAAAHTADAILFHSPIHYTSAAIETIATMDRDDHDKIMGLGVKETVQLAGAIARATHLDAATLQKVWDAYAPARNIYLHAGNACSEAVVRTARDVMKAYPDDPDIAKAGALFLSTVTPAATAAPKPR